MAEKNEDYLYFKIGSKRAKWETPDGFIKLSIFTGNIFGKVSKSDEFHYDTIVNAIRAGFLIDTKKETKEKVAKKEQIIDLTNIADERNRNKINALEILRKLKKEELLQRIDTIKNPYLVASMIEHESRGHNVSKRRRDDVMKKLKSALEQLSKDVKTKAIMVNYLEDTDEEYKITRDKDPSQEQGF